MSSNDVDFNLPKKAALGPFRRAVLRGLGVLLPPLLTIVIFLWIANTVIVYLLEPLEGLAGHVLLDQTADILTAENLQTAGATPDAKGTVVFNDLSYQQVNGGNFVPSEVYTTVEKNLGTNPLPPTAKELYIRYIQDKWLQRRIVIPVFMSLFILSLYLLGKFLAAGFGRIVFTQIERLINRLPLIRNVYSSVKQITDFMFTNDSQKVDYSRVVAIEYPRKGIWSLAMVTGESLLDIRCAANEPLLTVLIPTSPMPFTGYTVTVKKSESIDLSISIDQAFQFIVSCGVVVPPGQQAALFEEVERREQAKIEAAKLNAMTVDAKTSNNTEQTADQTPAADLSSDPQASTSPKKPAKPSRDLNDPSSEEKK